MVAELPRTPQPPSDDRVCAGLLRAIAAAGSVFHNSCSHPSNAREHAAWPHWGLLRDGSLRVVGGQEPRPHVSPKCPLCPLRVPCVSPVYPLCISSLSPTCL